ncbi:MAG: DUF4358 domain-containing protein, partial [Longicatena sp.]
LYYPFYNGDSKTSIQTMDKIASKFVDEKTLIKQDATGLKRYFGIDVVETDGFVLYTSKSMMGVDEVLIIKLKANDKGKKLYHAVENRIDKQKKNFDGYGTNQTELLNNKQLFIKKGYLFYGVAKQVDTWKNCFQDAL